MEKTRERERPTATDNQNAVLGGRHGLDVRRDLGEIGVLVDGLRHDGEDAAQARGHNDKVVVEGDQSLAVGLLDHGLLGGKVDLGHAALQRLDVGYILQGRHVLVGDPCLLGVVGRGKHQWRADDVV